VEVFDDAIRSSFELASGLGRFAKLGVREIVMVGEERAADPVEVAKLVHVPGGDERMRGRDPVHRPVRPEIVGTDDAGRVRLEIVSDDIDPSGVEGEIIGPEEIP